MMGLGTMDLGFGPLGDAEDPETTAAPLVSVAWLVDGRRMTYVLDAQGNPLGMDGTDQRVLLKIVDATVPIPVIVASELSKQEQAYRTALAGMVKAGAISDLEVAVFDDGGASTRTEIRYRNLRTSRAMTLSL